MHHTHRNHAFSDTLRRCLLVGVFAASPLATTSARAAITDIVGGVGSAQFGTHVLVLSNGNIAVTDPEHAGGVGAMYLLRPDGTTISRLIGSRVGDRVGSDGVFEVGTSNVVVVSRNWSNGDAMAAGAVTWVDGTLGLSAAVGPSNSLVGDKIADLVGLFKVVVLENGNYVVRSPFWDSGTTPNVGAVTFGNGNAGVRGVVSAANSLVGSSVLDQVGYHGVVALSNGNYVVCSSTWANGSGGNNHGAVTWGSGVLGVAGLVSSSNSLVGTAPGDLVGRFCVVPLSNGNYVAVNPYWHNGGIANAGAVTFGNGAIGISGPVSASNSLVGASINDHVGIDNEIGAGVVALSNGNYVVASPNWNNGGVDDAGAVTFGNGIVGVSGSITSSNSLVGTQTEERVGNSGVTALSNGNYVIATNLWDNGSVPNVGAVTWASGTTGRTGTISAANSLIGNNADDNAGNGGVTALSNGNYVVASYLWNISVVIDAGAVTWGNGATGTTGTIGGNRSLTGARTLDFMGLGGVTALSNGHYIVRSPNVDFQGAVTIADAGTLTWRDGSGGAPGITIVSLDNSLFGLATNSLMDCTVRPFPTSRYAVACPNLQGDMAGGVSIVNGAGLVGGALFPTAWQGSAGDQLGSGGIVTLDEAHYAVVSPKFDSERGAISLGEFASSALQMPSNANSVVGAVTSSAAGDTLVFDFNSARDDLVVGQPLANRISILNLSLIFANGFE